MSCLNEDQLLELVTPERQHLDTCDVCRSALDQLEQPLMAAIAGAQEEADPDAEPRLRIFSQIWSAVSDHPTAFAALAASVALVVWSSLPQEKSTKLEATAVQSDSYRQRIVVGDKILVVQRNGQDRFFGQVATFQYAPEKLLKPNVGDVSSIQPVGDGANLLLGGGAFSDHATRGSGRLRLLHLLSGRFDDVDIHYPNKVTSVATHQNLVAWAAKTEPGSQDHDCELFLGSMDGNQLDSRRIDTVESTSRVALSPDGSRLALASEFGTLRVWDLADPAQPQKLFDFDVTPSEPDDQPIIHSLQFSPDGKSLLLGAGQWIPWGGKKSEGNLLVLELAKLESIGAGANISSAETKDAVKEVAAHQGPIFALATAPSGDRVVTAGADGAIKLWDLATGDCLQEVPADDSGADGHAGVIQCLDFSADGELIASGGWDNTVRVWKADTLDQLANLTKHEYFVQAVHLTTDGKWLVSGGADGTVRFWKISYLEGA